jgi:exopolysaccharide biosynthesis polyprenyl glycosylphosphotransferase
MAWHGHHRLRLPRGPPEAAALVDDDRRRMTIGTPTSTRAASTFQRASAETLHDVGWGRARPGSTQTWPSLAVDGVMLVAAVLAAERVPGVGMTGVPVVWLLTFAAIVVATLRARGLYGWRLQLRPLDDVRAVVTATALAVTSILSLRVLLGSIENVAAQSVRLWVFAAVSLAVGRVALAWSQLHARRTGRTAKPTLIVGAGKIGQLVAKRLLEHPEFGLRPVGFLDKEPLADAPAKVPVLGASWDLESVIEEHGVEHVVVTFSTAPSEVLLRTAKLCQTYGVGISIVPRLFEHMTEHLTIEHIGALPLLSARRSDPSSWQFAVKYAADRIIAGVLLVVALPLVAALALGVALSDGRPLLFRQRRIGRGGSEFEMLKFRTMKGERGGAVVDPELLVELATARAVLTNSVAPGGVEGVDRRTRFGAFLRRMSLDELPQLLNVLTGDMSLIGPRPERPEFVRLFERTVPRYADRHRVKPGITGWGQVNGLRGKTSLSDRVEWDNYYIENRSLWLDVKILLRTLVALRQHSKHAE